MFMRALEKLQSGITCGCQGGGPFLGRCRRGQSNVEGASLSPSCGFTLALLWVEANRAPVDQPGKGGCGCGSPAQASQSTAQKLRGGSRHRNPLSPKVSSDTVESALNEKQRSRQENRSPFPLEEIYLLPKFSRRTQALRPAWRTC